MNDATRTRIRVSQETIAVVTVGLALAALMVTSTGLVVTSIGRVSDRLDHNVAELRAEARADREAFARQIVKLTAGQAHLVGLVESLRDDRPAADAGRG